MAFRKLLGEKVRIRALSVEFRDSDGKESACNAGDLGSIPGWEDPLEKGKAPTPVFRPGEFHGLCSPWGHKDSDTTEQPSHLCTHSCSMY